MDANLLDDLLAQFQGGASEQIAKQLGTDSSTASNAISAALPMIVGALGRNAESPQGASDLLGALQRDHSGGDAMDFGGLMGSLLGGGQSGGAAGGVGDLLGGLLGGAPATRQLNGSGILGHIFGGSQARAEAGLGQASGLDSGKAGSLLKMLAPMVMSFLANKVSASNLDAGGLGQVLGAERSRAQSQGGIGGALMNAVLDQDGDGDVDLSDLLKMGGSLLGGKR